jgi:taurine dioxygenase
VVEFGPNVNFGAVFAWFAWRGLTMAPWRRAVNCKSFAARATSRSFDVGSAETTGTEAMAAQLGITPIEPFGAEIDLDLSAPLSSELIEALRTAYDKHHLLVFRNQDLSLERQRAFMAHFGPVNLRDLEFVSNDEKRGALGRIELALHSDASYLLEPPLGISFLAVDVAKDATSTFFSDAVRAYARLPTAMKERLSTLKVRHALDRSNSLDYNPDHIHPAILQHPRTGETILYVNELHSNAMFEASGEAIEGLLAELCAQARRDNVYEHKWRPGDFVMWDNYACCHGRGAVSDAPRTFQRVSLGKGVEQLGDEAQSLMSYSS